MVERQMVERQMVERHIVKSIIKRIKSFDLTPDRDRRLAPKIFCFRSDIWNTIPMVATKIKRREIMLKCNVNKN
jgi:hypothetical protein